jgi:hypothetical protein
MSGRLPGAGPGGHPDLTAAARISRSARRRRASAAAHYTATAEQLFLHRNTAQYQVREAEEARGRPLRDGRLDVELARLACHWLKGAVLQPGR